MNSHYYIKKLDELIDNIFKNSQKNDIENKDILLNLLTGKDSEIINSQEFKNYSKEAIRLMVEKKILLSLENYAVQFRQSYWLAIKDKILKPKQFINFSDYYLKDIKRGLRLFQVDTISEIISYYNTMIEQHIKLNNIDDIIHNLSTIELSHMKNLNANGRKISIDKSGSKQLLGGIFLNKDSEIGYGKFVNKEELIDKIDLNNQVIVDNKQLENNEMKKVINTVPIINIKAIDDHKKYVLIDNQISGNIYLETDLHLPNGEYVSVDEISLAVQSMLRQKYSPKRLLSVKPAIKKTLELAKTASFLAIKALLKENTTTIHEQEQIIQNPFPPTDKPINETNIPNNFVKSNTLQDEIITGKVK